MRRAIVVDLKKCLGCKACVMACKAENNTIRGIKWRKVLESEEHEFPSVHRSLIPRQCMHCDKPPCVEVCPVQASYIREEDRLVLIKFDRCIGCRYCMAACPYGAREFNWGYPEDAQYFDWEVEGKAVLDKVRTIPPNKNPYYVGPKARTKGIVEKCTFCVHRIDKGEEPACVRTCVGRALVFGDLDDPNSEVRKLLARRYHIVLLEELGTKPKVFYLL